MRLVSKPTAVLLLEAGTDTVLTAWLLPTEAVAGVDVALLLSEESLLLLEQQERS